MSLLETAIGIAVEAHQGQQSKDERPYILHPLHLMLQMETEAEMITAVLHDVVEDTDITLADLTAAGFSEEVLAALQLLTHDEAVPYEQYIAAIKTNPLASRVKVADLTHNMDIRRLPEIRDKDLRRLRKYGRAWQVLKE